MGFVSPRDLDMLYKYKIQSFLTQIKSYLHPIGLSTCSFLLIIKRIYYQRWELIQIHSEPILVTGHEGLMIHSRLSYSQTDQEILEILCI